jgi:SepF-like predicted cell division protein (DUF552 family)
MLDYKLPYHVIQEDEDEDIYLPKLSFSTLEDAKEFINFAPHPNLIVVKTKELKNYYLEINNSKFQF